MNVQRFCLAVVFALAASVLALEVRADDAAKGSATGTWQSTRERNGQKFTTTYKLKQDGDKLTGSVTGPRNRSTNIEDGTVKGGKVSFKVTIEFNGNKFTRTFKGDLKGDTIKGKMEFERNGETQSLDWEATRVKEEK